MTFLDFIKNVAPESCAVHSSFGHVAELVFNAEKDGTVPAFDSDNFETTRERAQLAAPYQTADIVAREHVLDVVELAICNHRQANHSEDHSERIELLKAQPMSPEELEMATMGWWNE